MSGTFLKFFVIALRAAALGVSFLTFFTAKLTFPDDPSVALVACIRYASCPEDVPDAQDAKHHMLTGLKESLPLEDEYGALRQHEEVSIGLVLLAFVAVPLARHWASRTARLED